MSEQRMPSTQPGRRSGDLWKQAGKIVAILLALSTVMASVGKAYIVGHQIEINSTDIFQLTQRVTVLEQYKADDHYMTCYMFQRVNADGVPASCNTALRSR